MKNEWKFSEKSLSRFKTDIFFIGFVAFFLRPVEGPFVALEVVTGFEFSCGSPVELSDGLRDSRSP